MTLRFSYPPPYPRLLPEQKRVVQREAVAHCKYYPRQTVADELGVSVRTVHNWLAEASKKSCGHPRGKMRVLTEEQRHAVMLDLTQPPSRFGYQKQHWTIELVRVHASKVTGVKVTGALARTILRDFRKVAVQIN